MTLILNLGCGAKTSPRCINIDRNIHLRIARNPIASRLAQLVLSPARKEHLGSLTTNIRLHDLRKGIPYPDNSVDAVYHSHILEHIDRDLSDPDNDSARKFLEECRRVLKPAAVLRIVVPDLETRCRDYLAALDSARSGLESPSRIDEAVDAILGQAVRKESSGTSHQTPLLRWIENRLLGDARERGETHQWEYDSVSISSLLRSVGFADIAVTDYQTSRIENWNDIGLDLDNGHEHRPGSLYIEAIK